MQLLCYRDQRRWIEYLMKLQLSTIAVGKGLSWSHVNKGCCFLTPALQPRRVGLVLEIPGSVKECRKLGLSKFLCRSDESAKS